MLSDTKISQFNKYFKPQNVMGYLFIAPALVFYTMFTTIPIFTTIYYSLHEWNGADPIMRFVGLQNYFELAKDKVFWQAFIHNIIWIVSSVCLPLIIGLFLAILVSAKEIKGKVYFRVTYFLPAVLSTTVVAYIWDWMYNPNFGILNSILRVFGVQEGMSWLGDEYLVLPSLILAGSWTSYGFCMVVFLAAIQMISPEYNEVAKIEGASRIQTTFYVTIPLLRNVIVLMTLNTLIGSMKVFDIIYLLTKGGPYNSSEVIATYMFKNTFELYKVGYGSAIALSLATVICIFTVIYMRLSERRD